MPSAKITSLVEKTREHEVEARFAKEVAVAKILAHQFFDGLRLSPSNDRARKMDWPQYWMASGSNWMDAARGVIHLVSDPDPLATGVDTQNTEEHAQYWEIYVPTVGNDGRIWTLEHHQQWDTEVLRIAGGLTLTPLARGRWNTLTAVMKEKMIPVRVACTRSEMLEIMGFTKKHYQQLAVLAYVVSNEVLIR